jgi:hypothetical protein
LGGRRAAAIYTLIETAKLDDIDPQAWGRKGISLICALRRGEECVRAGAPMAPGYGTPFTKALHVVERCRLIDYEAARAAWERGGKENSRAGMGIGEGWAPDPAEKGRGLQLQFTVEDQAVFTTPWSATKTYRRVLRDWPEQVCAENPHGAFPTPAARARG